MNPTLFEFGAAMIMLAASVVLVVWFFEHTVASSEKRMARMQAYAGVDPAVTRRADAETIMYDVRSRCLRCRSEDLCDRWFAGKVEGDNSFCPNAQVFRGLTKSAAAAGRPASS